MKEKKARNKRIMTLKEKGYSFRAIAEKLGISVNRVYQIWERTMRRRRG